MKEQTKQRMLDLLALLMGILVILGRAIPLRPLEKVLFFAVPADRLLFSALTIVLLFRRFLRRRAAYPLSRELIFFLGMMGFWILYGVVGVFVSPYSRIWEGGGECFLLLRGMMIVYCMYELLDTRHRTKVFMNGLRIICAAILLLALWESLSGIHFWTSRYPSMPTVELDGRRWMTGLYLDKLFLACGICYNENNFSSILAILLPLFFLTKGMKPGKCVLYAAVMTLGVFVLLLNDANINGLALLVGLLAYILVVRGNWGKKAGMLAGFALLYTKAADWLGRLLLRLKGLVFRGGEAEELLARAGLSIPVDRFSHIPGASLAGNFKHGLDAAADAGEGALMLRIRIYQDGWDAFKASHGLGLGPDGYYWYFLTDRGQRTRYLDPHNWWMEVLCEYGLLVFLAYLISLLTLYIRMIRAYLKNQDEMYALVVAMCTSFVIACVAPSGYIAETYQWILPGLCLTLLRQDRARPSALE